MVAVDGYPVRRDVHWVLMEGNTKLVELHELLKTQFWKAQEGRYLLHDDVIETVCVVRPNAVSYAQFP
jgi:hypothetical protein